MIPKGKVSTYGSLAAILKSSPRAVGQVTQSAAYALQLYRGVNSCATRTLSLQWSFCLATLCSAVQFCYLIVSCTYIGLEAKSLCTRGAMPSCSQQFLANWGFQWNMGKPCYQVFAFSYGTHLDKHLMSQLCLGQNHPSGQQKGHASKRRCYV